MKITFRQSGGFAGFLRGVDLDTDSLEEGAARELESLVQSSRIEGSSRLDSPQARDLHQYNLTIETEGGTASLTCDDASAPDASRPLIQFLKRRARPMPST